MTKTTRNPSDKKKLMIRRYEKDSTVLKKVNEL